MKMLQKCISGFLAVLILLAMLPVQAFAAEISFEELPDDRERPEVPKLPQQAVAGEPLDIHLSFSSQEDQTPEELYEEYASRAFFGAPSSDSVGLNGVAAGRQLRGDEVVIYDALKPLLQQIAAGTRAIAEISIGQTVKYEGQTYGVDRQVAFSGTQFTQEMLNRIVEALLADLPYDLYWYDKVTGCAVINGFVDADGRLVQLSFVFTVAENYRGKDAFTADTDKTGAATRAASNAREIVEQYAGAADYEKLLGYQNEIHDLVSYDFDAAEGGYFTTDIDPWQMISVFDGDPDTNVVCEGYSKAYMYLCDKTAFLDNITCHTITGYMEGMPHMWNIVDISGKHYLVDVTNSDTGTVGESGGLFLAGGSGNPTDGYLVNGLDYVYDAALLDLWGTHQESILTLKDSDYNPDEAWAIVASGLCGDSVVWTLDNVGVLRITGTGEMYEYTDGTMIPWSEYQTRINTVEIGEGVTSICPNAFYYHIYLSKVTLPSSITQIGACAFAHCSALTSIELPQGLQVIEPHTFEFCVGLTEMILPDTVTEIREFGFASCEALKEITFSAELEFIYNNAFQLCYRLKELTLPAKVVNIGSGAFSQCIGLVQVTIPESLTSISPFAFSYCSSLTDVYYTGTEEQWNQILIMDGNHYLLEAEFHCGDLDTPAITKLQNTAEGIKITWGAVPGAARYRVYVKENGKWKNLGNTTGTSFVYTAAESGKTYTFTVRCVNAANTAFTSGFNAAGWTQTYVAQPAVSGFENTAAGIKVTWGAVAGAGKYRVYVDDGSGWKKAVDTTATSFVYTAAKSGVTYTFSVRAMNAEGTAFVSSVNETGWKQTYVEKPAISKFESTTSGVKITWKAVAGAEQYRLFVKNAKGGWTTLGNTTGTSFTWTGAKAGTAYIFSIRCVSADGKRYTSSSNTAGWKYTYYPTPVVTKMESNADGIKITWGAINGAGKYRVYVDDGSGWQRVGDTTATSLVYTGVEPGKTYTFSVRAMNAAGKAFVSAVNETGWKHSYVAQPAISKFESTTAGVKISWKAVTGAEQYRLFVKNAKGGWSTIGTVTGTSLTWTGAETGVNYTFSIRCVSADGKSFTSSSNTAGWKYTYYPAPEVSKLESTTKGVKLTWGAINGAEKYRVYVKTAKGWQKLTDTTGTSFTWTGAELGQTYTFTVRCLNAAGTAFTSGYNAAGWSHKFSPAPEITKLESVSEGVKITWGAINGAENYRVFVKNAKGGWSTVGTVTGTGFTWTGAKRGQTYTFTVRCLNAAGTAFTSPYNATGWSHTHS